MIKKSQVIKKGVPTKYGTYHLITAHIFVDCKIKPAIMKWYIEKKSFGLNFSKYLLCISQAYKCNGFIQKGFYKKKVCFCSEYVAGSDESELS